MAEWPNVPDSKSGVPQGTVGSNPTLSAKDPYQGVFFRLNPHINQLSSLWDSTPTVFSCIIQSQQFLLVCMWGNRKCQKSQENSRR